ncbi:MAG: InlB B-repeat-containing protein, partial [Ruminococcus sp.]|nr:InlB B-repeat-containing protein [Ruminococcus sp.]
ALDGYMFAGWYSDAQLTEKVYDNTPYTFTVSGDTSLYAKFVISKGTEVDNIFAVYKSGNNNPGTWTDYYKVYTVPNGSYKNSGYTHMFDINLANVEANKEFYFAISSTKDKTGMYWQNKSTDIVRVAKEDPDGFLDMATYQHYNLDGTNFYFGKIKVTPQNLLSLTGVTVYVKASGTDAGQYLVVPKGKTKPADTVTIYAKNGTLNTTSAYGTTTVTGINDELKDFASISTPYSTYYGLAGDRIIAQTEVNATQAGYGWYVYAYVINGVEYLATKVDGTDSTYQMDTPYIVQEGQDVEITPIYLNANIEKEDGYVTLYVDPNDLGDHWGNTISVYSYYYVGASTENAKQMNSAYPGEPMMLESTGLYKAFIPKDAWEVNDKDVFAKVANCPVSGLTLNNYMERETVHQNFLNADQKKNYQTYDYDDFKIIAAAGYDTVKFDVKYRTTTTNPTNQSTLLANKNNHPGKDDTTFNLSDYTDEWEDLTDIDGNLASIVGFTNNSVPSGVPFDTTEENKLYIVSTGNQNTSMGEWSTVWYVYDHSGTYITQGLPSDFIPRYTVGADGKQTIKDPTEQTAAYKAIYDAGKQYTSAYIAYESEQDASTSSNSGNSGTRLDGRWYYARSDAELSVTTHVLYTDTNESATKWSEDTYNSDLTGAYTGALATVEDVRDKTVSRNTSVTISASPSSKGNSKYTYKFVGWATNVTKNDDGTYTPTKSTTLVDSTSIFSVVSDTDVYALYVPVGEGYLVVNHSAYSTVNSGANGGTGRYFVQAVVKHNDNTTNTYYAQNGVTVPITSDDQKVDVTLYTVSTNGCSYVGSYVYNGLTQGYNDITLKGDNSYVGKVNPASAPATATHTIKKAQLFNGANQLTKKLDYYSDLKTNTITVKLNYYDRKLVNGSPADISDKETTYTYKPATYPSSVYEKNAQGELVLKLSNLITYTVSNAVKPDNALDDYYYWTSQSEAVTAMSGMYNYHTGKTYGETPYHTDHYGNVQNTGDKWVTYYKADGTEIAEGNATAENVSTISIWYFNTPKKYSYTMSLATDSTDLAKNASGTYYYGTKEVTGTKELLYNQRLGGEDKTLTGNEASKYLQAYGVTKGYVDIITDTVQNLEVTEQDAQGKNVTKALKFVGWATDTEGKNIVSTNYKYGLRITGNVKVYAIYGETELNHPGVNVQGIKPEQYFDEKNVSKTRISTTFTPYNCLDNDPNIANIGIVYLRVANSTTEKALENISDEDLKTLRYNIAKVVSKAEYSSFKSGTLDSAASTTIVNLSGSTASGFKYKVVDQINTGDSDKQAVLSNKNTGQITQIFSTSVIKGYTYYTFATMGYKNYPDDSTDDSVYADTTDPNNVVTYITSDNFAKFEFNSNGVCVTEF